MKSWHDPSSLGLSHIYGSRQLFKSWIKIQGLDRPSKSLIMTQSQMFLVSSMVYWEVLVSFLVDQPASSLSYLGSFLEIDMIPPSYVCPWTGVGTSVFIYLAKVGSLVRRKRFLKRTMLSNKVETFEKLAYGNLLSEASLLEDKIRRSKFPRLSSIEDTGDSKAPPIHFLQLAHCYQLSGCLELYRAFPELAKARLESDPAVRISHDGIDKPSQLVLGLAFDILNTLETMPDDSRTIATQTLAFTFASSVLGKIEIADEGQFTLEQYTFNCSIERWRRFVLQRLSRTYKIIGLRTILRAKTLLVKVWSRMDRGDREIDSELSITDHVHWIDVIEEEGLETLLG